MFRKFSIITLCTILVRVTFGNIRGIKIGNGVPSITHLLFADDSLFFLQANDRNCRAIKRVFDFYEACSGQKINTSKSTITYGSQIQGNRHGRLSRILGIFNQGGAGKYLGLPEVFRRRKSDMFHTITERVKRKTSSWPGKHLTPAGKEIMLKSVAISMPVYSMSCFKLPTEITDDITQLLRRCWWEKSADSKGISWIAWDRLKLPKSKDGLGFKDLPKFNDSLLAKQAWRLLKYPDSLFARLFKAKYYRDSTVLDARPQRLQSYGWSSILIGLNLLKKGLCHSIGDGEIVTAFQDTWLQTTPPRAPVPLHNTPEMPVSALIVDDGRSRQWNQTALNAYVHPDDHEQIRSIYLSQTRARDEIFWIYSADGNYTVRSGYQVAWDLDDRTNIIVPPHGNVELKIKIWALDIPPRLHHFLWSILSKSIATTTRLRTRGLPLSPTCRRCGTDDETIEHLFFTCPTSRSFWSISRLTNLRWMTSPSTSEDENISAILERFNSGNLSLTEKLIPIWILWHIWISRNGFIFQNKMIQPEHEFGLCLAEVQEWIMVSSTATNIPDPRNLVHSQWIPPPQDYYKCNYDMSYDPVTSIAFGGWLLRNHMGQVQRWGRVYLGRLTSVIEAEGKALLNAIASSSIFPHVIFEGGNLTLIRVLTDAEKNWRIKHLASDIIHSVSHIPLHHFTFVKRSGNRAAHLIATAHSTDMSSNNFQTVFNSVVNQDIVLHIIY